MLYTVDRSYMDFLNISAIQTFYLCMDECSNLSGTTKGVSIFSTGGELLCICNKQTDMKNKIK